MNRSPFQSRPLHNFLISIFRTFNGVVFNAAATSRMLGAAPERSILSSKGSPKSSSAFVCNAVISSSLSYPGFFFGRPRLAFTVLSCLYGILSLQFFQNLIGTDVLGQQVLHSRSDFIIFLINYTTNCVIFPVLLAFLHYQFKNSFT